MKTGFCTKASCARCPLCQNVCGTTMENSLFFYQCGACNWNSKECNIVVQLDQQGQSLGRLELARAVEDLGAVLKRRRDDGGAWQDMSKSLTTAWEKRIKESKDSSVDGRRRHDLRVSRNVAQGWSIETLESSLQKKKQALAADDDDELSSKLRMPIQRLSLDDDTDATPTLDESLNGVPHVALQLQALNRVTPIQSRADLLPLPIPLRTRNSRRCRAELKQGRPGILIKPKLNPLEGDSSLRSGHGQWFKKVSVLLFAVSEWILPLRDMCGISSCLVPKSRCFLIYFCLNRSCCLNDRIPVPFL